MFLAPTAFVLNDVCRAEREVSYPSLTRTVPRAHFPELFRKSKELKKFGQQPANGPVATDKFRHGVNDGFRQWEDQEQEAAGQGQAAGAGGVIFHLSFLILHLAIS